MIEALADRRGESSGTVEHKITLRFEVLTAMVIKRYIFFDIM
jgi:hypothetical protein